MLNKQQAFTIHNNGIARELVTNVHVGQAFDYKTKPQPVNPTTCNAHEYRALWDTGATGTVVTEKVVTECGLIPTGMVQMKTVGGQIDAPTYLISLFLPNHVVLASARAAQGTVTGADILIGMDVICQGDFAITNVGNKTTFSFSMPSERTIDFVKEQQTPINRSEPKIGRNSQCPCGSGKKYKKCCGKVGGKGNGGRI